jgi:hypothetical protein
MINTIEGPSKFYSNRPRQIGIYPKNSVEISHSTVLPPYLSTASLPLSVQL